MPCVSTLKTQCETLSTIHFHQQSPLSPCPVLATSTDFGANYSGGHLRQMLASPRCMGPGCSLWVCSVVHWFMGSRLSELVLFALERLPEPLFSSSFLSSCYFSNLTAFFVSPLFCLLKLHPFCVETLWAPNYTDSEEKHFYLYPNRVIWWWWWWSFRFVPWTKNK